LGAATIVVIGVFAEAYEAHFAEYSRRVRDFLDSHSGVVVRRQRVSLTLEGDPVDLVMLIDFPSREIASTIFQLPEYQAILPLRARIFRHFTMLLADAGEI
jgi:uncharacterized protein (DUF1330 family)